MILGGTCKVRSFPRLVFFFFFFALIAENLRLYGNLIPTIVTSIPSSLSRDSSGQYFGEVGLQTAFVTL